ncbi:MAG: Slp family lipoprotein [Candidatus Thiodiazotropha sp. 6PLUC2]
MSARLLILGLLFTLWGCSSSPVIVTADRSLLPKEAAEGAPVPEHDIQWGGIIIATKNLNQVSEVEILAYPLDDKGKPTTSSASIGRFIARQSGYLESGDYASGRLVTATGQFSEVRSGLVGEAEYSFPVLICDQLALWPKEREARARAKPRIHFGFGASSGGSSYGGIGIGIGF